MSIYVLKPGMLTAVQDLGRFGFQKYGVSVSGAMDKDAAKIANLLVGNAEEDAVLEVTLSGAEFRVEKTGLISVCGGDLKPVIDGEPLPMWRPLLVKKGSRIRFRGPDYKKMRGCRAYIAAAGGIDVPVLMGSRSTYLRGEMGGYSGRMLQTGDVLTVCEPGRMSRVLEQVIKANGIDRTVYQTTAWYVDPYFIYSEQNVIRVMEGAHFSLLTADSKKRFALQNYLIEPSSDRMGYRLRGSEGPFDFLEKAELLSEGVTEGTLQLPPGGEPILLLTDRQTTGGYPRIAQAASVDLPLLAQLPPGARLSFQIISVQMAEYLLMLKEEQMDQLRLAVRLKALTC